jgi:uncharacterized protein YceK
MPPRHLFAAALHGQFGFWSVKIVVCTTAIAVAIALMLHWSRHKNHLVVCSERFRSVSIKTSGEPILRNLFALMLIVVAFSGCATIEKQAFNREAHSGVRKVALIEPRPTTGFGILIQNHPALHLGLIGAAAYAAEMNTKSNTLDSVMKPLGWSLTEALTAAVAEELTKSGYEVVRINLKRDSLSLVKDYSEYKSNPAFAPALLADAWIDLATRDPLYIANGPTSDYVPSIGLTVRMVSSKDQTVLYREDFLYGYVFQMGRLQPVLAPSAPAFRFANMEALTADPKKTLEGMAQGVPLLAKKIAEDIAPARR